MLRMTQQDWPNAFDVAAWVPKRPKLQSQNLTIGRHGRPHPDKWPATGDEIRLSLPGGPQSQVKIMGADRDFLRAKGVDSVSWDILDFNQVPVPEFLDGLDIFSYHHSPLWVEAFGRTIAEAMLMEVRCVLSPALKPTFGPHAIYGDPADVPAILDHIRANLAHERAAAAAARDHCLRAYSTETIVNRLEALCTDTGTVSRTPKPEVSPLIAAKKLIGFRRRRWRDKKGA
jgi:hypothetical protein